MKNKRISAKKLCKIYSFIPAYKDFKKKWNLEVKRIRKDNRNDLAPNFYIVSYYFNTYSTNWSSIAPIKILYPVRSHFNFIRNCLVRRKMYNKIVYIIMDFYETLLKNESDVEKYVKQMNSYEIIFEDLLV